MYWLLFFAVLFAVDSITISGSIFKFKPNLTVFDTKTSSTLWRCAGNKPVRNTAVYLQSDVVDYTVKELQEKSLAPTLDSLRLEIYFLTSALHVLVIHCDLQNFDFLDDCEIIFSNGVQIRPSASSSEQRCSGQDASSSVTYSWHDPANWINAEENDIRSNFVHAQRIPGDTDTAAFSTDSSYLVVMDIPVRVGLILANNVVSHSTVRSVSKESIGVHAKHNHSTKSFLQHMRSFEGGLQFRFGPSITAEYVWSDLNLITDALTITSQGCNDDRACLNSNLEKKFSTMLQKPLRKMESLYFITMLEICSHVSCHPTMQTCSDPIKPVGHCCEICGFMIHFESSERFLMEKFSIWTHYLEEKCGVSLSIMKIGDNLHQVVAIMQNDTMPYNYNTLKQFVDLFFISFQQEVDNSAIVKESIKIVGFSQNTKSSIAPIVVCIVIILIIGLSFGYLKREKVRNLFVRERVNLTAFWGSDKASEPHRDDRMLLEFSREMGASSSTISTVSSPDANSPKVSNLESFMPGRIKAFLMSKKIRSPSTGDGASLEMRYPKQKLSASDTAREMSSATTFTNPMFDKNYSLEYDE